MDHSVIGFIEGIVTFVVVATVGLAGVQLWLRERARARPQLDSSALAALSEENSELRARLAELEERVDFVERRLVQGQQPSGLPREPDRTPV
jgi:ABC-type phosphate transport system auxiliary subunit